MNEVGMSLGDHRSKSLGEYLGKCTINHVIIVCAQAEQECPRVCPFALQRHFWLFDDPAAVEEIEEQRLLAFRRIRDEIRQRVTTWLAEDSNDASSAADQRVLRSGSSQSKGAGHTIE